MGLRVARGGATAGPVVPGMGSGMLTVTEADKITTECFVVTKTEGDELFLEGVPKVMAGGGLLLWQGARAAII